MKMKKIAVFGVAGVLACSSLTACGSKVTLPKEPAKIAAAADKETAKLDSFDGSGKLEFAGKVMGEDISFDADISMTYFREPMKLKVDVNYAMQDEKDMTASVYFMQEDDNYVMYTGVEDNWEKMTLDEKNDSQKKLVDMLDKLQKSDGKIEDTEKNYKGKIEKSSEKGEDGTTVLNYKVTGEEMEKNITESGAVDQLKTLGLSEDLFADLKDLNVKMVVDNDTLYWKSIETDCTEFTQCILDKVMDTVKTMYGSYLDKSVDLTAKLDKVSFKFTLDSYNKSSDFKLPDKAKDAKETNATSLLEEAK